MAYSEALKSIETRFRAYQLNTTGSSFSYYAAGHFTLIEARLNDGNRRSLVAEMNVCDKRKIDTLHITSWDTDHCSLPELEEILQTFQPRKIEYPGYEPHTVVGQKCLKAIKDYRMAQERVLRDVRVIRVDPPYIKSLSSNEGPSYEHILYHPKMLFDNNSNDNSTVKMFRTGMFNVASLGDIEHGNLSAMLRRTRSFMREVDVLILAHHGSDSPVNSKAFFEAVRPSVAICSNDYANRYGHPDPNVRVRLRDLGIRLFTTKRGDVLVRSLQNHRKEFEVINYQANSAEVSDVKVYESKKFRQLTQNLDTRRNVRHPGFKGLK
ncbi:hypothetical protein MTR80_11290 [Alcaligenes aquatilis]|uniref:MBL fold metallo-hydrolase n=1 Tax=Alcaligenes aquatilis TaxID=323284 RepID=A0ABY4NDN6_9BURK|nr:hypothetical protein [Alcaligenes aquatilis]UQN34888.1 hypothetical protein MTR80_11290 [Alcaligenes aquatilis]